MSDAHRLLPARRCSQWTCQLFVPRARRLQEGRRTCRKLVALTQFWKRHRHCRPHVARPSLPEEMHILRLLYEFENQVMPKVSGKSDVFGVKLLETTLGSGQVFGP